MRRSWFDKFFRGEDEDYEEEEEQPLPEEPVAPPPTQPTPTPPVGVASIAPTAQSEAPAPTPPLPEPISAPAEPPASAMYPLKAWANAEVISLLNELSPAGRERIAEALQIWHDVESQLQTCFQHARSIADASTAFASGTLAAPDFEADAASLAQAGAAQGQALVRLQAINRGRAHEWVMAAVQGQRQWAPEKVIRLFIAAGIGPLTLNDLLGRLRSMDAGPRAWAAEALGALDDPETVPALLNLLRDPDAGVRAAAVSALGRRGDPGTLHALGQVVKRDPEWSVRLKAIAAAQCVQGYEAIGFLDDLLRDKGWWRELQVLDGIGRAEATQPTPPKDLPAGTFESIRRSVLETLLERIQAALPSADPAHRGWLMDVLGDTGDARAVPLLTSALQDAEQDVRLKAIHGLGAIGGPGVVDLILPALKDQQSQVRIQAAEALGETNDFRAVEPLLEALREDNQFVRAAVTVAIGKIVDTRALKPLIAALNDPDKDVRAQTQAAIQRMSDPRTMTVINGMLEAGGLRKTPPGR